MLIGLTGGIGSGKTTVATFFAELNISVIKADDIVHTLIQPNSFAYKVIINKLGKDLLSDDLQINRSKLRQIVFTNQQSRRWLEGLLHPQVYQAMATQIKLVTSPYCVLEIPLLLEKAPTFAIDRILVIDCPVAQQISRTINRDNIPAEAVQAIILAQIDRHTRLTQCHDIIVNDSSLAKLKQATISMHNKYMTMVGC